MINRKLIPLCAGLLLVAAAFSVDVFAQRKTKKKPAPAPQTELAKLREEFVKATNEYKASLAKLLPFHEEKVKRAEEKLEQSRKLFAEGLIPRAQLEESERALTEAKSEVAKTQRDMANADAQAAGIYAETDSRARNREKPSPRTAKPRAYCFIHAIYGSTGLGNRRGVEGAAIFLRHIQQAVAHCGVWPGCNSRSLAVGPSQRDGYFTSSGQR